MGWTLHDRRGSQDYGNAHQSYWSGQYRGQFTGRGPKGYQRSDERITEDINEALTQHPELDASEIEVKVQNGQVTLNGMVSERHYKRIAEDGAERCSGVHDVRNEIRVQREQGMEDTQGSQQQGKGAMASAGAGRGTDNRDS